jgi:hypothetical protein
MQPPQSRSSLLPSFGSAIFLGIFLILLLKSGSILLADGDTGYHIRTGEYIIHNRTIPTHDLFSYLAPPPAWTAHEWLSEVVMAVIFRASGLSGIVIFFSFFLAVTHVWLYRSLKSVGDDLVLVIGITAVAVATSSTHWLARPHLFSLALTLVWYEALNDYQFRHKNTLIYLPPLMLLWVNLHGGFVIGLVLLVIYTSGNFVRAVTASPSIKEQSFAKGKQLALFALLCAAVTVVNPQGYGILFYPFKVTGDRAVMNGVAEFLSPNFHQALPFKYMLLILIASLAWSRARLHPIEVGLIVLFTYMALYSVRYVSLFAIIVSRPLLRMLESAVARMPPPFLRVYKHRSDNLATLEASTNRYLWPAIAISATVALALAGFIHFEFSKTRFPVAAVEFLKREAITGNTFNLDEFGDYMIFAAWPQYRVFIDGRSDMYGANRISDYRKIAEGRPEWQETLDKYDISWVFFDPRSPIVAILRSQNNWSLIYSDEVASILVRNNAQHRSLINKYNKVVASN